LHENGVIDIDENYFKYIPEFKNQNYEISARMLAAHTAGYPYTPEYYLDHLPEVETFRDYITLVEKTNLQFLPDTKHEFSDNNIALLALLAEDVSNTFYKDLLKERILDTLHLKNTVADNSLYITPNRSGYYSLDYIARLINAPEINLQPFLPMHGLLSTAEDLNTFGCQLLEPGFFNQQTIERFTNQHQLLNGQKINRSQGFLITFDKQNRKIVYFPGNTIGGSSAILIYPDEKLVVSMCANKGDELAALPAYQVSEFFMNQIVTPNKNRISKAAPDSGE
jgi:CubicO group peptidase (beta-lactamase class C family)